MNDSVAEIFAVPAGPEDRGNVARLSIAHGTEVNTYALSLEQAFELGAALLQYCRGRVMDKGV